MSAYACGPGQTSEPGAGWQLARAAAVENEVWVITRHRFREAVTAELAEQPALARWLHPVYIDLPEPVLKRKTKHRDVYWYYPLWQFAAGKKARDLHASIGFDVLHHATFATDWMPCGLVPLARQVPLVWGPVGGCTYTPRAARKWLGPGAAVNDVLRETATKAVRRVFGDRTARAAQLTIGMNSDTLRRYARHGLVICAPNVVAEPMSGGDLGEKVVDGDKGQSRRHAVFVGRLVSWKGTRLALHALARPEASGWHLQVIGEGPEREWMEREVRRLGIDGRVAFHGQLPVKEVQAIFASSDAMLFPSLHDSASWAVAEATAAGLPVICLAAGGPPEVAGPYAHAVPLTGDIPRLLAAELASVAGDRVVRRPSARWSAQRLPAQVSSWYRMVLGDEHQPPGTPSATRPERVGKGE